MRSCPSSTTICSIPSNRSSFSSSWTFCHAAVAAARCGAMSASALAPIAAAADNVQMLPHTLVRLDDPSVRALVGAEALGIGTPGPGGDVPVLEGRRSTRCADSRPSAASDAGRRPPERTYDHGEARRADPGDWHSFFAVRAEHDVEVAEREGYKWHSAAGSAFPYPLVLGGAETGKRKSDFLRRWNRGVPARFRSDASFGLDARRVVA